MINNTVKKALSLILPRKIYNFLRIRPRIIIASQQLAAQTKHIRSAAWRADPDDRGDLYGIIRKRAHIIDKGLQSSTRKAGHSKKIAEDLKQTLPNSALNPSTHWANGLIDIHSKLQQEILREDEYAAFPFANSKRIDPSPLIEHIKERRSIRHFKERSDIIDAEIISAIESAPWAASSCNRQTIKAYVTFDKKLSNECANLNKGATSFTGEFIFVSICFDSRSYHLPQESLTGYIDASLGAQNIMLMLHGYGYGACVLNWSHASPTEEKNLRAALRIPPHDIIVFNMLIGIPKLGAPVPARKTTEELLVIV